MLTCGQLQWWGWGGWINPPVYHSQHAALFMGSLWRNSNWLRSGSDSGLLLLDPQRLATYLSFASLILLMHIFILLHSYSPLLTAHQMLLKYTAKRYGVARVPVFWQETGINSIPLNIAYLRDKNIWEILMILSSRIRHALEMLCLCLPVVSKRPLSFHRVPLLYICFFF